MNFIQQTHSAAQVFMQSSEPYDGSDLLKSYTDGSHAADGLKTAVQTLYNKTVENFMLQSANISGIGEKRLLVNGTELVLAQSAWPVALANTIAQLEETMSAADLVPLPQNPLTA
jgi:hypothetical protein